MKKIVPLLMSSGLVLIMSSCKQDKKAGQQTAMTKDTLNIRTERVSVSALKGDYCFMKAENKDTTSVHLAVSGDQVKGEMTWQPWEKDGAAGTLLGKLISDNEMEVLYDYTIEGSKQTETKIMKIDQDKLYLKVGELTDPKNNGNLVYKDPSKAVYSEVLNSVSCK